MPISWVTWSNGAGGAPEIVGDPDWGKLALDVLEQGRSYVYNYGDALSRTYTLTSDLYGSGQGVATLQVRGDTNPFLQDADEPPNWEDYAGPFTREWQYVQVREIKQEPPS